MSWQNISAGDGIAIAITGMAIVFVALILVSLFIAGLPRLLPLLSAVLPVVEHHHTAMRPGAAVRPHEQVGAKHDEIVAAIAFAMHRKRSEK